MTQDEVAERLGRPQALVSRCESGKRRVDVIELVLLARIYKKPINFFEPEKKDVNGHEANQVLREIS